MTISLSLSLVTRATARAPFLSYGQWKIADARRQQFRVAWQSFFTTFDLLVCPIFSRSAFEHDHRDPFGLAQPFVMDCGRTLDIDGEATSYMRHIFWSGLTNACYLPSTAFPSGFGKDSNMPIGLQIVGAEGSDYLCIEFARLLETELNYAYERPRTKTLM